MIPAAKVPILRTWLTRAIEVGDYGYVDEIYYLEGLKSADSVALVVGARDLLRSNMEKLHALSRKGGWEIVGEVPKGGGYQFWIRFGTGMLLSILFDDIFLVDGEIRIRDIVKIKEEKSLKGLSEN